MYKAIVLGDYQSVVHELNELESIGVKIDRQSLSFSVYQNRVGAMFYYDGTPEDIAKLQADAEKKRKIEAEIIAEAQKKSAQEASEKQDADQKKSREAASAKAKKDAEEAIKVKEQARIDATAKVEIEKENAEKAKQALAKKVDERVSELR